MGLVIKIMAVVSAFGMWQWTQKKLGARVNKKPDVIQDFFLNATQKINEDLQKKTKLSRFLLISSSLIIDTLGIYLIITGIWGSTVRPILGLIMLFTLRQISQSFTMLPAPKGMIWKYPGFPSLFVTYKVSNDLFFSGHTALAIFAAIELARLGSLFLLLAIAIALYEVIVVLLLRAHWTLDVFTGIIAAFWIADLAQNLSPAVDAWLSSF